MDHDLASDRALVENNKLFDFIRREISVVNTPRLRCGAHPARRDPHRDGCAPLSVHPTLAECRALASEYQKFDARALSHRAAGDDQLSLRGGRVIAPPCGDGGSGEGEGVARFVI